MLGIPESLGAFFSFLISNVTLTLFWPSFSIPISPISFHHLTIVHHALVCVTEFSLHQGEQTEAVSSTGSETVSGFWLSTWFWCLSHYWYKAGTKICLMTERTFSLIQIQSGHLSLGILGQVQIMFMTLNNAHLIVALIITIAMQLFYYVWVESLKQIILFWAFFLFL